MQNGVWWNAFWVGESHEWSAVAWGLMRHSVLVGGCEGVDAWVGLSKQDRGMLLILTSKSQIESQLMWHLSIGGG